MILNDSEIVSRYGECTGYISCTRCPINMHGETCIDKFCPEKGSCNGFTDAYDSIRNYFASLLDDFVPNKTGDAVNHPEHYTQGGMECIDEMLLIFGKEAVKNFCLCNAWKYRARALYKNGEEDMQKSNAYIRYYKSIVENGIPNFNDRTDK